MLSRRVVDARLRQGPGDDHTRSVDTEMQLLPASPPPSSMFRRGPFTLAHDREARAVDNEMPAGTRGGATQREVEMLATPGERGVIGRGQVETQHPEDRRQEAFSLPQGQVDDEPERQRGFDGEIGILRCLHRSLLIRQPVSEPTASSASTARLRQIPWAGRSRTRARRPQRYVA